jgi:dTDP-4-dehydrorhamnose reductase
MVDTIKEIKHILVTGSSGMLGSDIVNGLKEFELFQFDKNALDITNNEEIINKIDEIKPDVLINCAAYTDVDGSEKNKDIALKVNAYGVKNIAEACSKTNAILVHFSSDYVFDGSSEKGYEENEKKNPISHYGYSKSLGEDFIQKSKVNFFLIRSSWLFGKNGKNFVKSILNKKDENEIKVVNDQVGTPTYTKDLAKAIRELITQNYDYGIYHITNYGSCTWFEFAKEILKNVNSKTKVIPITSKELNRPAKRPKCSILINTKFKNKLPLWNESLKRYLGELK